MSWFSHFVPLGVAGLRRDLDWGLFGLVTALIFASVAMIYSLTAGRVIGHLAFNQAMYGVIGLGLSLLMARFDYRRLRSFSLPLFIVGLILLGAVFFFGTTIFGATRWIDLLGFQFQPSELMKLLVIIILAHILTASPNREPSLGLIGWLLLLLGLAIGLVLRQPDLGTAAVIGFVATAMLMVARLPRTYWFGLIGLGAMIIPFLYFQLQDYQIQRLETFFQPTADPLGAGYNVLQSIIAVGNGGIFGAGLGQGTQSQLDFLPVVHTDFIFAGIAESVGFVGSVLLIVIMVALLLKTLVVAKRAPDQFGVILVLGIVSLWFIQFVINVGMNLGLAPVTGIPLPFVSYGGTALIVNLLALGIVESVASRCNASSRAITS